MARPTLYFDYDGTLHDSVAVYAPAFRTAYASLVEQGLMPPREFTDEWIASWLGYPPAKMWNTFAPGLAEEHWLPASILVGEVMVQRIRDGKARLFDGVEETMDVLAADGWDMVFLSNCRNNYQEAHAKSFNLGRWFSDYYTSEAYDGIPKWEIYREAAKKHGPGIMIGDRFLDLEVGLKNGIPFIGCLYGFPEPGELDQASALVTDPRQIPEAVQRLL